MSRITARQLRAADWSLQFEQKRDDTGYSFQVWTNDLTSRIVMVKLRERTDAKTNTQFRVTGASGYKRTTDSPFIAVRYYNEDEAGGSVARPGSVETIGKRKGSIV